MNYMVIKTTDNFRNATPIHSFKINSFNLIILKMKNVHRARNIDVGIKFDHLSFTVSNFMMNYTVMKKSKKL